MFIAQNLLIVKDQVPAIVLDLDSKYDYTMKYGSIYIVIAHGWKYLS